MAPKFFFLQILLFNFPVPCPTNLLFSCVPQISPVPCAGVSYEKHPAPAPFHIPPPPVHTPAPPVYTRPAPMPYGNNPSYRATRPESKMPSISSGKIVTNDPSDIKPMSGKSAEVEANTRSSVQDWS